MGIHPDYNLQSIEEHIQIEYIADNQIECIADKGRRSTFQSMLHEEGRRCCCLPRRGAGPAACRGGALVLLLADEEHRRYCLSKRPVLLLADEGHRCRCCCLPLRVAARGEHGRATGKGRGGVPATGNGQRRACVLHTMRPPKKKRKGIFSE
jgi:hypothetical protein